MPRARAGVLALLLAATASVACKSRGEPAPDPSPGDQPRRGDLPPVASSGPTIRPGAVTVDGALPAEVVQRVVRANDGRFRLCYVSGLGANPKLAGSVAVKFVVGSDGAVSRAADGGSDLPDQGVVACVVGAFRALSFPPPDSGTATVIYPMVFSPP